MFRFRSLWIILALVHILSQLSTAEAGVVFSLRGDNMAPRYALGGKAHHSYLANANLASPPAVIAASSISCVGCFGSSVIDVHLRSSDTHAEVYPALNHWPLSGSNVFSLRIRFVPTWTGAYSLDSPFLIIGHSPSSYNGGMIVSTNTDGTITAIAKEANDTGAGVFSITSSAVSFTSGTAAEIMIVCDGTNVYMSKDGVQIGSAALTFTDRYISSIIAGGIVLGPYASNYYVDELTIWDSAEAHVYTPRTAYLTVADFDGTSSTDPGVANVLATAGAYSINGVSKTGILVAAATSNVKAGVTFGPNLSLTGTYDGSDRWTCPNAGDLRLGAPDLKCNSLTTNLVGTLVQVNNQTTAATLGADASRLTITKGDTVTFNLTAANGSGVVHDLTGATFTTYISGLNGKVSSFGNSKHSIVSAAAGTFTLALTSADTRLLLAGANREVVVKVTQGSSVTTFRGLNLLTIRPEMPIR